MSFLTDVELLQSVSGSNRMRPIVENVAIPVSPFDKNSAFQPSSLDVSIGKIFLPYSRENAEVDWDADALEVQLLPGETAVVTTKEVFQLPSWLGAICFPPARVAKVGLLNINTGHIDPGYSGHLTFTLINMSRDIYDLKVGEVIASCLIYKLSNPPRSDYLGRGNLRNVNFPSSVLLRRLSRSFLDIEKRAGDVAHGLIETLLSKFAFVGMIGIVATLVAGSFSISSLILEPLRSQSGAIGGMQERLALNSDQLQKISEADHLEAQSQLESNGLAREELLKSIFDLERRLDRIESKSKGANVVPAP